MQRFDISDKYKKFYNSALFTYSWSHFKACLAVQGRVVTALGKHWCVEHFVCAKCEKPFLGNRHYERKGLAYCETHYHQLFGNLCYISNQVSVLQSWVPIENLLSTTFNVHQC